MNFFKIVFIFTFLFQIHSLLIAQEVYKLSLFNTDQQVFSKEFYLESVQDARKDTFLIGLVSDKAGAIKEPAAFDGPLRKECFFALRALAEPAPDKKPVRMRIHHIFIDEFVNVTVNGLVLDGRATVEMQASFEMLLEGAWREVFRTSCFLVKKGPVVHLMHPLNVSEALTTCWKKFNAYALSGKIALQAGHVRDTSLVRPRGVYQTYYDFLYQTPDSLDITRVAYTRTGADTVIAATLAGLEGTDPFAPWGFSDGHQVFVCCQSRYMPLCRTREGLSVKGDRLSDLTKMLSGVNELSWTDLLGMQAGPLLYSLIARKKQAGSGENVPFIYLLEPETGLPVCSPTSRMEVTTVHLLTSKLLLDEARVEIRIDGEAACTLAPDQLYSLKIQSDHLHPLLEVRCGKNVYRTYLYPSPGDEMVYLVRQLSKRKLSADVWHIAAPEAAGVYKPNGDANIIGKAWLPEPAFMQDIRQHKYTAPCAEGKR